MKKREAPFSFHKRAKSRNKGTPPFEITRSENRFFLEQRQTLRSRHYYFVLRMIVA